MIHAELERLLKDIESDRTERTISLDRMDKFCEAICAFSNDLPQNRLPGYLFIGATPDGTSSGVPITDQILQNLASIRSAGNIQPLPVMTVQKWKLGGGEMAVIEVQPSDLPPVRYKGQVWIRVGPRKGIASETEERILTERRAALARTWDARPCREATLSDLALDLFTLTYRPFAVSREVIEENHRSIEEQLGALRFYDLRAGCPTHAAVLLFAKDPLFFLPGAYVQYVHYEGRTQADRIQRDRKYSGDLLSVMRGLDELCKDVEGARPVAQASLTDRVIADYPPRALHELLMNAVIHRNYEAATPILVNHFEDRIEILSLGGLYGDLIPEQFPRVTAYRNPVIAEAAKALGFVNRFGRGIDIARAELQRNGSPPPKFELEPNHVLVTVWRPV
jgi:ATP-dependent DNA helicase RecG